MTAFIWIALGLVGLYLFINLLVAWFTIHPFRVPLYISPGLMGFPQEKVDVKVGDLVLTGWWCPHENPKGVIVATHGYIMNRCEWVPLLPILHPAGWSCLFVDFRGQGRSSGALCTFGANEKHDVHAMIDVAMAKAPGVPVVLLGSSMGAAASVYAAVERPQDISGLILDGVYSDLDRAGRGWWKMVGGSLLDNLLKLTMPFGRMLSGIKPKNLSVVDALQHLQDKPMLLAYGTSDPIVPLDYAKVVVDAAGPNAEVEWFDGSGHGHGRFREPQRYHECVLRTLKRVQDRAEVEMEPSVRA